MRTRNKKRKKVGRWWSSIAKYWSRSICKGVAMVNSTQIDLQLFSRIAASPVPLTSVTSKNLSRKKTCLKYRKRFVRWASSKMVPSFSRSPVCGKQGTSSSSWTSSFRTICAHYLLMLELSWRCLQRSRQIESGKIARFCSATSRSSSFSKTCRSPSPSSSRTFT